jgi:hypothetical protein
MANRVTSSSTTSSSISSRGGRTMLQSLPKAVPHRQQLSQAPSQTTL